ncbi:hypothetical protein GH733_010529, partial [Mirounga leonina]
MVGVLIYCRESGPIGNRSGRGSVESGITWVLVYRTDKYKRLKAEVEKQSKKLDLPKQLYPAWALGSSQMPSEENSQEGSAASQITSEVLIKNLRLSHRNLLGDDTTDCSFIFLYILCTMSIRQNIQKILGLAPSRAATKQA